MPIVVDLKSCPGCGHSHKFLSEPEEHKGQLWHPHCLRKHRQQRSEAQLADLLQQIKEAKPSE